MRKPILHSENQQGQAILLIAAVMVALIATLGLAIDGGGMFLLYRDVQNATDSAGLSAAYALCTGQDVDTIVAASALENGFVHGVNSATVEVEEGPDDLIDNDSSSPYYQDDEYLAVRITSEKPSYFIQIVYPGPLTMSATTIARCKPSLDGGWPPEAAIIGLYSGACPNNAFKTAGNGTITIHGDLYINQEDTVGTPCSLKSNGNNQLYVDGTICTQGRFDDSGDGPETIYTAPPPTGVRTPVETDCDDVEPITDIDPLDLLPPNDPLTCPATPDRGSLLDYAGGTAPPGTYSQGQKNYNSSSTVTLDSGVFCFKNGISISNGEVISHDDGVTIYMDCDSCLFDQTGGNLILEAQQSGDYAGLLLVSRSTTTSTSNKWNGGGTLDMTGTVYMPWSNCEVSGGSDTELVAQFICLEFTAAGGAQLEIWYLAEAFYSPPPEFGLSQ